jgi:regulator of cell morphogenesis and NO signaling
MSTQNRLNTENRKTGIPLKTLDESPALGQLFLDGQLISAGGLTVRQIVAERPRRARVFEAFGISYCCCGGSKVLAHACEKVGADVQAVEEALRRCDAEEDAGRECDQVDWMAVSTEELLQHIESAHHASLRTEIPRLIKLAGKVAAQHGDLYPELWELHGALADFSVQFNDHIAREKVMLAAPQNAQGSLAQCHYDHEQLLAALDRIRGYLQSYVPPEEACNTYRVLNEGLYEVQQNVARCLSEEDEVLFPRIVGKC